MKKIIGNIIIDIVAFILSFICIIDIVEDSIVNPQNYLYNFQFALFLFGIICLFLGFDIHIGLFRYHIYKCLSEENKEEESQ